MKVLWHSNPAERCVHSAACFSFGGQRNTFLYRLYYLFVNEGIFSDSYLYLFVFCSSTLKQNWCLLCTALLYLIYSWELWFLHPGALIQLVGFYVSIVHCGIMLSDLLHVKSLLKFPLFLLFFFLLWEPENPFHVKIAACLWTHWLIGMWFSTECKFAIFFFFFLNLSFASTISINAELSCPCSNI